jgi:hypothetical protein
MNCRALYAETFSRTPGQCFRFVMAAEPDWQRSGALGRQSLTVDICSGRGLDDRGASWVAAVSEGCLHASTGPGPPGRQGGRQ